MQLVPPNRSNRERESVASVILSPAWKPGLSVIEAILKQDAN